MAKKKEMVDGDFIGNCECICGLSSDAMSVYTKEIDGERVIDAFCRSGFCERDSGYISPKELEEEGFDLDSADFNMSSKNSDQKVDLSFYDDLPFHGWRDRIITKSVSEKYNVRSLVDDDGKPIARFYPEYKKDELVGLHKRVFPKTFSKIGNGKANNQLFGQVAFEKGQKYLVIVTGQEDAMALAQVLKSEKGDQTYWTPVVSITCGDGSAMTQIKANYEYVNSFEKVILMFDNDESAQKEVEPIARLLSPGKAHIAKLPSGCKDAND